MVIVGIDCATDPKKVGLALGSLESQLVVKEARTATSHTDIVETVSGWMNMSENALLALDAPLGWPSNLGASLNAHMAGNVIDNDAHSMFRRATDIEIKRRTDQQPLDVGADRIARTALATLRFLDEIRSNTNITMAWQSGEVTERQFIEVYPAATLKVMAIPNPGYKRKDQTAQRQAILDALDIECSEALAKAACADDNVLDSIICVLAGKDFAQGRSIGPSDLDTAKKEGWIWVR